MTERHIPEWKRTLTAEREALDRQQECPCRGTLIQHTGCAERAAPALTDCGEMWESLTQSCYVCNGGPHYHYANGACDTEPCERHGGPR